MVGKTMNETELGLHNSRGQIGIRIAALLCGLLVAGLLTLVSVVSAAADSLVQGIVIDEADALTPAEERELRFALTQWGSNVDAQIGVVFIDDVYGRSPARVADEWFDSQQMGAGARRDGVMLLVAIYSRDMHILLNGEPYRVLPRRVVEDISAHAGQKFTNGEWAAGARVFGEEIHQALRNEFDRFTIFGRDPLTLGLSAAGGIGSGALLMVGGESVARRRMRNVGIATRARQYVVPTSAVVMAQEDVMYDEDVTRVYMPPTSQNSGSSSSGSWSGGGSRGGYSSKF